MGRARIDLEARTDGEFIPFDYQYYLASALYKKIEYADPTLSKSVHEKVRYKQFTFSWMNIPHKEVSKNGISIIDKKCHFLVSSPSPEILRGFVDGLLSEPEIRLGKAEFMVEKIHTIERGPFGKTQDFDCISPILVRTIKEADGRRKVWDLEPSDPKFFDNLRMNLDRKFSDFRGEQGGSFEVVHYDNVKQTRIRIKDTYNRAYFMRLRAQGDPALMTFAYDAGLGERNSMGFGMLETA